MSVDLNLLSLSPALAPMMAALLVLAVDVVVPRAGRTLWGVSALGSLVGVAGVAALDMRSHHMVRTLCTAHGRECSWQADRAGLALQAVGLLAAVVVAFLALFERRTEANVSRAAVRAALLSCATAGSVGVVAARDLGSWLVLVELATIPGIALVALRGGRRAVHGALSLLVMALVSFAVQALGAAMWFAATGSALLSPNVVLTAFHDPTRRPLLVVAVMLVLAGVGFKLSLAPFHSWTPETFAGSGGWVAAFLATTSKVGALGAMLVVLRAVAPLGSSALVPLGVVAALSMTVGNLMALRQRSTLRLLAWSTVAQAGWVVLPMTVLAAGSVSAAGAYLALYALGTLAVFVVVCALEEAGRPGGTRRSTVAPDRGVDLADVRGLFRTHPLLAGTLALGLLALAGLPPSFVGVVAKIVALKPVVTGGVWWLVVLAVLNVVLGVAVYGRWILAMFAAPASQAGPDTPLPRTSRPHGALAALVALILIAMSLAPQLLLNRF